MLILFTVTLLFTLSSIRSLYDNVKMTHVHPLAVTRASKMIVVLVTAMHRSMKDVSLSYDKEERDRNVAIVSSDEEVICKMFTKWFSAEGHKVKSTLDGEEALKLVEKERFDVVFLDVIMPGLPSLVVLDELKRNYPKTKVVMITGRMLDKEFKKELKEKGAPGFIQKPFNLGDILGFLK